jgi:hypothetical protein
MIAQIDQAKAAASLARKQDRLELAKLLAVFATAVAAVSGVILGVAHLLAP